ncbi:MAG: twin-arginine translocase subunit TatC [Leucothrix sp.]
MSKKPTNNTEESKLSSFVSHLFELRDRLLKMVIAIGVFFIILAPFARYIYDLFAKPLADTLPDGVTMLITGVAAPLLVPYKLVLMAAFLIALPYVFYQAWQFVAPGLYKHEKRLVFPLLASSVLLFYCGIAFAYFVLLPMMFTVLPMFTPDTATYSPDIGSYLDFVMMMFIAFGFSFEMPIATILLISTGTTTAEKLAEKRPYVIVGAFVVGMILTPPDVISQILLAVPMWILFELGLFLSKFFNQRVAEAGLAKDARDKADADAADRLAEESEAGDDSVDRSPKPTVSSASTPLGTSYIDTDDDDGYRRAEEAEANDDSVDLSPQSTAAAAAKTSVADQANALWSDEATDLETPQHKIHNEGQAIDTNPYQAFENYAPKSEEELDAELDAIEAEELAEEQAELEKLNAKTETNAPAKDDEIETLSALDPDEIKNLENELAGLETNENAAEISQDFTDRLAQEKAQDPSDKT